MSTEVSTGSGPGPGAGVSSSAGAGSQAAVSAPPPIPGRPPTADQAPVPGRTRASDQAPPPARVVSLPAAPPPPAARPSRSALAAADLLEGLRCWELWGAMGLQGLRRGYRRSILGPLWLTISLAVLVTALGLLYGQLFNLPLERYIPHVALGFIAWQFVQAAVNQSCTVFVRHKVWITNARRPLAMFVFKDVWENLLTMAHNGLVYVGVAVIFGVAAGLHALLLVPGLALVVANAVWVGLLLGTVCARFRDVAQIVGSVMRVVFFVTPVIWIPDQLGPRAHLALYNPFTYFIELVRAPLLGQGLPAVTWMLVLAVTAAGWTLTWLVFARYRSRVPYWV